MVLWGGSEAMVCKSVSFTEEKKWFYEGGSLGEVPSGNKSVGFFAIKVMVL